MEKHVPLCIGRRTWKNSEPSSRRGGGNKDLVALMPAVPESTNEKKKVFKKDKTTAEKLPRKSRQKTSTSCEKKKTPLLRNYRVSHPRGFGHAARKRRPLLRNYRVSHPRGPQWTPRRRKLLQKNHVSRGKGPRLQKNPMKKLFSKIFMVLRNVKIILFLIIVFKVINVIILCNYVA